MKFVFYAFGLKFKRCESFQKKEKAKEEKGEAARLANLGRGPSLSPPLSLAQARAKEPNSALLPPSVISRSSENRKGLNIICAFALHASKNSGELKLSQQSPRVIDQH